MNLGTTCLTFEEDPEPFGKIRDNNIKQLCKELDIEVIHIVSHTLYNLEKYESSNQSTYTCLINFIFRIPFAMLSLS